MTDRRHIQLLLCPILTAASPVAGQHNGRAEGTPAAQRRLRTVTVTYAHRAATAQGTSASGFLLPRLAEKLSR